MSSLKKFASSFTRLHSPVSSFCLEECGSSGSVVGASKTRTFTAACRSQLSQIKSVFLDLQLRLSANVKGFPKRIVPVIPPIPERRTN